MNRRMILGLCLLALAAAATGANAQGILLATERPGEIAPHRLPA